MGPLCWQWPGAGYERILDEFMLGDAILVAPVLQSGARRRSVVFPPGEWVGDDGTRVRGPVTRDIDAPLARLPFFRRVAGAGVDGK